METGCRSFSFCQRRDAAQLLFQTDAYLDVKLDAAERTMHFFPFSCSVVKN